MSVRNRDSTDKVLAQCAALSTGNDVVLSANFWREYHCPLGCGGCCYAFTLDYLPKEWDAFSALYPEVAGAGKARMVRKKKIMSIFPQKKKMCGFLDEIHGACLIHKSNPLSCELELIKVKRIKEKVYLTKAPYARAWAMKTIEGNSIQCSFSTFSEKQLFHNDIPALGRLLRWANYFNIATHLPDILQAIQVAYDVGRFTRMSFDAQV